LLKGKEALNMESPIKLYKKPKLRAPYLITGWPDAGQVGMKAVSCLKDKSGAEAFGEIEIYDFSLMPHSVVKRGVLEGLEFPQSELSFRRRRKPATDFILFRSAHPDVGQYRLANLILDVAEEFGVQRIYTAGGLYAKVPHTVRAKVLALVNTPELRDYARRFNVGLGLDYHGPTSMNGLLIGLAKKRGIEGISLWGQVPNYIAEMPNPMVAQDVLEVLTEMLSIEIDMSELEAEAEYAEKEMCRVIDYLRQQRAEFNEYIERLEQGVETESYEGDELIEDIEKFLKRKE
jgi:hypothetical protein